ncbi:unnamed protein product [Caenorhabditis angaria]|uniref:dolichol kinase n=1 Tax=Caenorhabditis angaria TaxID=860376 RepID=A0A9P1MZX7_9PELO|nr:unnamed protein product [Caenorhabditis angaria]
MPPEYYSNLAIVSTITTIFIVSTSILIKNWPVFINVIYLIALSLAIYIYGLLIETDHFLQVFEILLEIVTGNRDRLLLISFWLFNVAISVVFCTYVKATGISTTIHRKFFHLTVSLIYISGILYDAQFTWICAWLWLAIFILVENLRYFDVPPWSPYLNEYLLIFRDIQDSDLLMTPIYLLTGIFLPLLLIFQAPNSNNFHPKLYHFAGIASVGVGDSFAAIIGSKIGKTKWRNSNKSLEGTISMIISMFIFLIFANIFLVDDSNFSIFPIFISSVIVGFSEAFITKNG